MTTGAETVLAATRSWGLISALLVLAVLALAAGLVLLVRGRGQRKIR